MKKTVSLLAFVLAALMMMSVLTAFADQAAAEAPDGSAAVDPLVGSWRFPPSPFGDDFACYVVLNADGSFYNATNLYQNGSTSGPYTQTVTTNETFVWKKLSDSSLELHYSYLDANGEFVTPLTYNAADDKLYWGSDVYAFRDDSFVLLG